MDNSKIRTLLNKNHIKYNENSIKLIIESLIKKYSLETVIDCIISITTAHKNIKKAKNEELYEIISLIIKNIGILNTYKYLLNMKQKDI